MKVYRILDTSLNFLTEQARVAKQAEDQIRRQKERDDHIHQEHHQQKLREEQESFNRGRPHEDMEKSRREMERRKEQERRKRQAVCFSCYIRNKNSGQNLSKPLKGHNCCADMRSRRYLKLTFLKSENFSQGKP